MFERFSKSARSAVTDAYTEARALKSDVIDVEHMLLGTLSTASKDLRAMLDSDGLTYEAVKGQVIAAAGRAGSLGDEDAEALKSIGIDLVAIKESLEATFGADALDREPREPRRRRFSGRKGFTPGAKKALELSLREAIGRGDDFIGSEHLLLGLLRAPNELTRSVIEAHIPIVDLRRRLEAALDSAA